MCCVDVFLHNYTQHFINTSKENNMHMHVIVSIYVPIFKNVESVASEVIPTMFQPYHTSTLCNFSK